MSFHAPAAKSQIEAQGTAGKWYAEQAERLGVEPAEIEDAILRGWTGDVIAKLPIVRAAELAGLPPADAEHLAALEKIKSAPVMPMRLDYETRRRLDHGARPRHGG